MVSAVGDFEDEAVPRSGTKDEVLIALARQRRGVGVEAEQPAPEIGGFGGGQRGRMLKYVHRRDYPPNP
jgi:hypothetical protein